MRGGAHRGFSLEATSRILLKMDRRGVKDKRNEEGRGQKTWEEDDRRRVVSSAPQRNGMGIPRCRANWTSITLAYAETKYDRGMV